MTKGDYMMVNKYFRKRMDVLMNDCYPDNNGAISLEYYLLESEDSEQRNEIEINVCAGYGVEVVKVHSDKPVESNSFNNITRCKETAVDIINVLARNTVTPIELPYVLDNIIGVLD